MLDHAKLQESLQNIKWDLSLFYSAIDDPAIQNDCDWCRQQTKIFRAQYEGQIASLSASQMLNLMKQQEQIFQKLTRLSTYSFLNYCTQTQDATAGALMQRIEEFGSEIIKDQVFFELEWNEINNATAQNLLSDSQLQPYRHYLESMRRYQPYQLSQKEEQLLAEIAPVGTSAWTNLFEKVVSKITFGPKSRTLEECLSELYHPDRGVRENAAAEVTEGLNSQLHIFTFITNTLAASKMIHDRIRHYPHWLKSRNLSNEISDETVATLVQEVKKRYDLPQRYYRLKKQILNLAELADFDRYAPLPQAQHDLISWSQCEETVLTAFHKFSPEMAQIAKIFFQENRIDAQVHTGKRGGAFAHPATPDTHPYVMVNYTGTLRDVSTVAHELGHGIHQFLSAKENSYFNTSTPLTTAESASVFGEMLVFQYQLQNLQDPQAKLSLLCNKLESMFATVFRQISMFSYEDGLHQARREEGELSSERISEIWITEQKKMFGDSVSLKHHYHTWWSYIPHFLHTPGYVYAYAFGELLVLALYKRYQEQGQPFVAQYLKLLSAGGSTSPNELLLPFGVQLDDPNFWSKGLDILDQMTTEAEQLFAKCTG